MEKRSSHGFGPTGFDFVKKRLKIALVAKIQKVDIFARKCEATYSYKRAYRYSQLQSF
jgi:hypothetical protein